MVDVPHYTRDTLPTGQWARYRKTGTTEMRPITGPAVVETMEGPYTLPDGWRGFVAIDTAGYPYPVDAGVHRVSYELVCDEDGDDG